MRLLALTRYGRQGPSSRIRLLQYLPALQAAGIDVQVKPFFDEDYVAGLYRGRVSPASVLRPYARRLRAMYGVDQYDVIWLEKEILPWWPEPFERAVAPTSRPIVVDFDDAVFLRYDRHSSSTVRAVLSDKIDGVMRRAACVIVGNEYLAERARKAGSRCVEWLPTVVDLDRYRVRSWEPDEGQRTVVGWIGSPATAHFLQLVAPVLGRLSGALNLRCVAIGARADQLSGTPFEPWPWTEETEADTLGRVDIGIMPLPDSPFERGKCGYKLIQYMACGVPVIASPVGINRQIVTPDVGFLASTEQDWADALTALATDRARRQTMGGAGRASVERIYCLQVQAPRFVELLYRVAGEAH